jgi:hypothetical protein
MGEVDLEAVGDLLWAPRPGPTPVLAATVAPTDPAHLRACQQLAIGSGDRAGETILHVLARDGGQPHCPSRR